MKIHGDGNRKTLMATPLYSHLTTVAVISKQLFRYLSAAIVGYIFDFGTLILLHEIFNIHYLVAAASGFVVGLVVVYFLSTMYVFGESKIKSKQKEFSIFAVIGLVGLGVLTLLMWIMTDLLGINYLVSKVFATVLVYVWNFFARRSLYYNS